MNFTNREEYLAAAAAWKANYNSLIVEIRKAKIVYKEAQRAFAKCGAFNYHASSMSEHNKAYNAANAIMQRAHGNREALRNQATESIEDRRAMKQEAARQMNKA